MTGSAHGGLQRGEIRVAVSHLGDATMCQNSLEVDLAFKSSKDDTRVHILVNPCEGDSRLLIIDLKDQ
jgi:hypothetical protein